MMLMSIPRKTRVLTFSSQFRSRKKTYEPAVLLEGTYRSRLELKLAKQLETRGYTFEYEKLKLQYEVPATIHTYTPDIDLMNGIIVEAKGWLTLEDRKKMVLVKKANPGLDIRFVFQKDPTKQPIRKGSPTSYAKWCDKEGFPWAGNGVIPEEWLEEKADVEV